MLYGDDNHHRYTQEIQPGIDVNEGAHSLGNCKRHSFWAITWKSRGRERILYL